MTVVISVEEFRAFIESKQSFTVDLFSTACSLLGFDYPMMDLKIDNLSLICSKISCDIVIKNQTKTLYDVRKKYSRCLWFQVTQNESEVFTNFRVDFKETKIAMCQKTSSCSYQTKKSSHMKRHEHTCTDIQTIVEQQVAYGTDQTPILRLIELKLLPMEALSFRKTFFTTYDIESLENSENISELKNVVGIQQIVSIAVSTNQNHSRCFIREDSTHESAINLMNSFLEYLEHINDIYNQTIPSYFLNCIEKLQELTATESEISKRKKMEMVGLLSALKKYVLQDVFGFNSGNLIF